MAAKRYPPKIVAQAKQFFIHEGWGFAKISDFFDGSPHKKTIELWAAETDEDGNTWLDLRRQYTDSIVNAITPQQIQTLYTRRIFETLNDPEFSARSADALSKLQKQFTEVTDPGRQLPVMYELLTQLLGYIKQHYPELISKELVNAITEFKNIKRETFFESRL